MAITINTERKSVVRTNCGHAIACHGYHGPTDCTESPLAALGRIDLHSPRDRELKVLARSRYRAGHTT